MGQGRTLAVVLRWAVIAGAILPGASCKDNMFTGNLTPVPPVHRLPQDLEGSVILIDKDATVETKDPNHVARANNIGLPHELRVAMTKSLELAGFKVVGEASTPHDLVGALAIHVTEDGDDVRQVYRCGLSGRDGRPVAQVDWAWPKGTYVGELEVYDFATHNVATEVATSRRVHAFLRSTRGARATSHGTPSDAGLSVDASPQADDAGRPDSVVK